MGLKKYHMNNNISAVMSQINLAYKGKKLYLIVVYSHVIIKFLKSLQSLGVIQTFHIYNKKDNRLCSKNLYRKSLNNNVYNNFFIANYNFFYKNKCEIKIYLKYINHLPIFFSIRCYWTLRHKISIPHNSLSAWNVFKSRQTFILWTNRGFLTNIECLRLGIGGLLVCGLFL